VLFNRLLLIISRTVHNDLEQYFKYELTTIPTALFTDNGLRKTNKSTLSKQLGKALDTSLQVELPQMFVVDGGCLLHRVVWAQTGTYHDIIKQYLSYVQKHYGFACTIVFDGYGNGPSVKDHEHVEIATKSSPDIDVNEHNPAYKSQTAFLMNENKKQAFVLLLSHFLEEFHYVVKHANNDADTLIVLTALELAGQQK